MPRKSDPKPVHATVIHYVDKDGRRCGRFSAGARKVKVTTDSYYVRLIDPETKKRVWHPLGTTDLSVAWVRLRQLLEDRHKEALGILDDHGRQAARPIEEHLDDWLAAMEAGGRAAARLSQLRGRVSRLIELAGWKKIGQVRKAGLQLALGRLASGAVAGRGVAGRGKGASEQTVAHYAGHMRQFTRWLRDEGRLAADPLAGFRPQKVTARRHDRRCPGEAELQVLFAHLQSPAAPDRRGMTGPQRALGYEVAMCTGLRAGELRSLTRDSLDLATGDVRLAAADDKARKRRLQPLPSWLRDKLSAWLAGGGGLWGGFPAAGPGQVLEADLAAARSAWLAQAEGEERDRREAGDVCRYAVEGPDGPLFWDFHSLRHWYISQVAGLDGVSPAVLFELSRHVDPKLTLGVYAKARDAGRRDAVERIARPGGASDPPPAAGRSGQTAPMGPQT